MKRTKIVCTIGPASEKKNTLMAMSKAGMDVARLNFSHGTYDNHKMLLKSIRDISEQTGKNIGILQDLQGPKIRVGELEKELMLKVGEKIFFYTGKRIEKSGYTCIPVDYNLFPKVVKKGGRVLLDDGLLEIEVKKKLRGGVVGEVVYGGKLISHKSINIPEMQCRVSSMTDKDRQDLEFGLKQGVDFVALSFVQSADDIIDLKEEIEKNIRKHKLKRTVEEVLIIAKIEKNEALEDIDNIIEEVGGIMVARGDLGIEIPMQNVPIVQKMLIDKCLEEAKPVITATQMLDSMTRNPRPTRAEVSDVANAVIDHTDAVMLSGETAMGKFPVKVIETMSQIIRKTESSEFDDLIEENNFEREGKTIETAVSGAAAKLARYVGARAVVIASMSGHTGRLVSRYRIEMPVYVSTDDPQVMSQLMLSWGIVPYQMKKVSNVDQLIEKSVAHLRKKRVVRKGDRLVFIGGQPVGESGNVNLLKVHEIK